MSELSRTLDGLSRFLRRYVVMSEAQTQAVALWIAHTHGFFSATTTIYLWIHSAIRQSGKTRLLEVLELLVARPWLTGRVTPAVLPRRIEDEHPTLLLDEVDATFGGPDEDSEVLRGVLNTGHRQGGSTTVCVIKGKEISYRTFSTFSPKAFAGLKRLPDTVEDRSIPIQLKRRDRQAETVERFRRRAVEVDAAPLRQWFEQWASEAVRDLQDANPVMPDELSDRACDAWEPLFAIADLAGGDWPTQARQAAVTLSGDGASDETNISLRLLADIRQVFMAQPVEKIPTMDLINTLCENEESPWVIGKARGSRRKRSPSSCDPSVSGPRWSVKARTCSRGTWKVPSYGYGRYTQTQ